MSQELLITRRDEKILSVLAEDGKILQIYAEDEDSGQNGRLGNVYVGKVQNIVKNINAAFVEYSQGRTGYLSLSDNPQAIHTGEGAGQRDRVLIGDEIIVQVAGEAVKKKPPSLRAAIELTGRYIVLSTEKPRVCISKKIREKDARTSLRDLLQGYCCEEYGFIARTNSAGAPEETIRQEVEALVCRFEEIMSHGMHRVPFSCLYQAPAGYLCDIRDGYGDCLERIYTDDAGLYEQIRQYLEQDWTGGLDKLQRWDPVRGKLDAVYNISKTLEHALMPRVWLKSGAYLVIQPTEALVSIDVNTGKAISKKKDVQKHYRRVNREAAVEIARQLRLRNLSGIIIIDFIDMDSEEAEQELLEILRQAVRPDPVHTDVLDITRLGLVEMTRQKIRKSLSEQCKIGKGD